MDLESTCISVFHVKPKPNLILQWLILQQECVRDKVSINFRVCDGVQVNAVLSKQLHKAKSVKWINSKFTMITSGSVFKQKIFTIRFALGQNGDHFPFRDLQQEEDSFFPHDALKINVIHL